MDFRISVMLLVIFFGLPASCTGPKTNGLEAKAAFYAAGRDNSKECVVTPTPLKQKAKPQVASRVTPAGEDLSKTVASEITIPENKTAPESLPNRTREAQINPDLIMEEATGQVRGDLTVESVAGTDKIVNCDDQNVTVTGSGGLVLISGRAVKLTIKGQNIEVFCDIAQDVQVPGKGNKISLGALGRGTLTGSGNKLTWEKGIQGKPPVVTIGGENNDARLAVPVKPTIR